MNHDTDFFKCCMNKYNETDLLLALNLARSNSMCILYTQSVISPVSHVKHSCGFHLEQFNLAWYALHTQMLQSPVPVIVIKITEFLQIVHVSYK